ncbi:hypothetical protein [Variovorax paradoxus]|uniref:hypothetical protein n=1 Tax=Variovorax paradoxus TaxID=34073 RepID=UPI001ABD2B12
MSTIASSGGWAATSVLVRIQARDRRGATGAFRVEFNLDRTFVERMQQLRSLVPPTRRITAQVNLEIDKVRARLPNARWWDATTLLEVHKSGIVISADGGFMCLAAAQPSLQLRTACIPVSQIVQLETMRLGPEIALQTYQMTWEEASHDHH